MWLKGAQAHAQPGREGKFRLSRQVIKSCPLTVIETGKKFVRIATEPNTYCIGDLFLSGRSGGETISNMGY
jgi:hypothetical protein